MKDPTQLLYFRALKKCFLTVTSNLHAQEKTYGKGRCNR